MHFGWFYGGCFWGTQRFLILTQDSPILARWRRVVTRSSPFFTQRFPYATQKLPILVGWRSAVTQRSHVLVGKGSVDAPCFPFDAQDYLILVG